MAKRSKKISPSYKVYVTYFPNGDYYIGFTSKVGKPLENYFGSSKHCQGVEGLTKEIVYESEKKSWAKAQEHILQWTYRDDPRCLNDMWNIRTRLTHLKEFVPITWSPHD